MPTRELTDDETNRLLTQKEVDSLPDGTEVFVKWSGGNGPYLYEIEQSVGYQHAYIQDKPINNVTTDPESRLTKVFLPTSEN